MTIKHEIRRKLAMVIGVSKYDDSNLNQLPSSIYNGSDLSETLKHHGYTVYNEIGTVKGAELRSSIDRFFREQVRPDDQAIFYFSGHNVCDTYGDFF
jgi:Caspase domain